MNQNSSLNLHETEWIESHLKESDVCIDIGANAGYFTLLMAKKCRWVYAFEPEHSNFYTLFKNLSDNNIDNVSPYRTAVTGYSGPGKLYLCDKNVGGKNGMHRIYPSIWCDKEGIDINCIAIDDEIKKANFIKMDIEGAEYSALKGMRKLLERCKPTIMMEFYPPAIREYGANPKDVYDFLVNLRYSIRLFPAYDTPISYDDLIARTSADNQAGQNILCINQR